MKGKEIAAGLRWLASVESARVTGANSIRIVSASGSTETVSYRGAEAILAHELAKLDTKDRGGQTGPEEHNGVMPRTTPGDHEGRTR